MISFPKIKKTCISASAAFFATVFATATFAIQPQVFVQNNEADFSSGTNDNTVVTNLGDVKLAASTKTVGKLADPASIIYDLQTVQGKTYLAAGPEAKLFEQVGEEVKEVLSLKNEQIFALSQYQGKLLLAISGANTRLATLEEDNTLKTIADLKDIRYIWDMLIHENHIIIATGIEGKILAINPDVYKAPVEEEKATEEEAVPEANQEEAKPNAEKKDEEKPKEIPGLINILDAEQANILCLAMDSQGRMYAGTDTDGLVYRITPKGNKEFEAFVILDASEPEIGALLVTNEDIVYAGTADANQAKPGRISEAVGQETGRPEAVPAPVQNTQEPGELPELPPSPEPVTQSATPAEAPSQIASEQPTPTPQAAEPTEAPATPGDNAEATPQSVPLSSFAQTENKESPETGQPETGLEEQAANVPQEPTAEQHDRLRNLVRQKLEAARKSGTLQAPAGQTVEGARKAAPSVTRAQNAASQNNKQGNAIYRIDKDGFVSQVFRESVMILKLIDDNGKLLVGTGNEGQIFRIDPSAGETIIVANLESEQIPAMQLSQTGVLLGTANPAELIDLVESDRSFEGTYTSPVLDAGQVSLWGTTRLTASLPAGTSVSVETRSGNVDNPETAPWSEWSKANIFMPDNTSPLQPREMVVTSPPARYLQYRLILKGNDSDTPVIGRVATAYVTPNLRPMITSLKATYPEPPQRQAQAEQQNQPSPNMNIQWNASDPNDDKLLYNVQFQPSGSSKWITIAEDHEQNSFDWNTSYRAPDGWYYIRVIASDKLDNPGDMAMTYIRRSEPILVDNSAPDIRDLKVSVWRNSATITGLAFDHYSPIHSIGYVIDDEKFFHPILPEDLIFDSTQEQFSVTLSDLPAGAHVVTIKVTDVRGNFALRRQLFEIK